MTPIERAVAEAERTQRFLRAEQRRNEKTIAMLMEARAKLSKAHVSPIGGQYYFDDVTGEHIHCLDARMVAK